MGLLFSDETVDEIHFATGDWEKKNGDTTLTRDLKMMIMDFVKKVNLLVYRTWEPRAMSTPFFSFGFTILF